MRTFRLEQRQWVGAPIAEVFDFFRDPRNLVKLNPPEMNVRVLSLPLVMGAGAEIAIRVRKGGLPVRWLVEIEQWDPPALFVDVQKRGPFAAWRHTHRFEPDRGGTWILDEVEYSLPLGPLGVLAHKLFVRRDMERVFAYRRRRLSELFESEDQA